MLMLIAAAIVISVASTTSAQRSEARERLAKHNGKMWIANAILWTPIIASLIWR